MPAGALTLGLMLVAGAPAPDAGWIRVRTPHFEMLSDAPAEVAAPAALRLERFRQVMALLFTGPDPVEPPPPTTVVAFRSASSFRPFYPLVGGVTLEVDGLAQGGASRGYLAVNLGSDRDDPLDPAYHEYAHVYLSRLLPSQPPWVAEGLADFHAAWREDEHGVLLGLPRPEYVKLLGEPFPARAVLDAESATPKSERERRAFYARSWGLAHWLLLGRTEAGPQQLARFLAAIAGGFPAERAFRDAFGVAADDAVRSLKGYGTERPVRPFRYAPPPAEPVVPAIDVPSVADVQVALAELLVAAGRPQEAEPYVRRALRADPSHARALERRAWLSRRAGRWDEARRHNDAALAAAPDDPDALFRWAETTIQDASRTRMPTAEETRAAVAALERALEQAPGLADAATLLARLQPTPLDERIAIVERAWRMNPRRADLGLTLAGLLARGHELHAAARVLARTRDQARDDVTLFLAEHLAARVDALRAGLSEARGTLLLVGCPPDGSLRFTIDAAGRRLDLRASSPRALFIYDADGATLERRFVCAPQREPVVARYRVPDDLPEGADGVVASLTFER